VELTVNESCSDDSLALYAWSPTKASNATSGGPPPQVLRTDASIESGIVDPFEENVAPPRWSGPEQSSSKRSIS
jgi:hypothetical protein